MQTNRVVPAVLAAFVLMAAPVLAMDFGVRGGLYTEVDEPFVGIELLSKVGDRVYFNPNVEYVFVDGGKYGTFNFDAHYDLPTGSSPYVWIGAGLAFVHSNPDGPAESDTNAHANLLGGIGFRTRGGSVPYIQLKLITTDPSEFVVAAGIRF
jgi:hypothetical protein